MRGIYNFIVRPSIAQHQRQSHPFQDDTKLVTKPNPPLSPSPPDNIINLCGKSASLFGTETPHRHYNQRCFTPRAPPQVQLPTIVRRLMWCVWCVRVCASWWVGVDSVVRTDASLRSVRVAQPEQPIADDDCTIRMAPIETTSRS